MPGRERLKRDSDGRWPSARGISYNQPSASTSNDTFPISTKSRHEDSSAPTTSELALRTELPSLMKALDLEHSIDQLALAQIEASAALDQDFQNFRDRSAAFDAASKEQQAEFDTSASNSKNLREEAVGIVERLREQREEGMARVQKFKDLREELEGFRKGISGFGEAVKAVEQELATYKRDHGMDF